MKTTGLQSASRSGPAKLRQTRGEKQGVSVLEEFLDLLEESLPLRISFEDLSGVLGDVKEMELSGRLRQHACDFCMFAKSRRTPLQDCMINKAAANRVAMRRLEGYTGQCHLGLTDIVEPLVYKGRVLGVFYYGSVVASGTEALARKRIAKYCARRELDPAPFLRLVKKAPQITSKALEKYRKHLRLVIKFCLQILEAYGLPIERYRTEFDAYFAARRKLNPLAQAAIRYVHMHYRNPIRLTDVAAHVKCHPDYLCVTLRKELKGGFGDYVNRVRIDHALRLMKLKRFSLGEIAFQVGFNDQSYFNKIFKRLLGCTPGEYYPDRGEPTESPEALSEARPFQKRGNRL